MIMLGSVDASGFMLVPEASLIKAIPALFIELIASACAKAHTGAKVKAQATSDIGIEIDIFPLSH